ncbi:hypothetical protein [Dyadobacter sp. CY312]|nr:hypothetical protein [Dyadobacter sp. CY312]MCE7044600.1 hypothetical protein [Dyadobacter sp. CY312]
MENQIEIYQSSDGQTQIDIMFGEEAVWLIRSSWLTYWVETSRQLINM